MLHTNTHTDIYIYIYIERERERETDRQTDRQRLPLLKNDKMVRQIGARKLAYVDETQHLGEIEESSLC